MTSGVGAIAILAGAAAMVLMAGALYVLGKAIQEIAKGFDLFTPALLQLAPMSGDLLLLGFGMMALGAAAWFAFPGLLLAGAGLALMVPGLTAISLIAQMDALGSMVSSLSALGAAGPGLALVGASLLGIAGGLSMMALSGLMALPIIGALIGLAAVAPALSGLMGGGGEGEEEDKMQVIADKLDQLISVASKGGEINMDGRKVGEIVRLGLNTSNVR